MTPPELHALREWERLPVGGDGPSATAADRLAAAARRHAARLRIGPEDILARGHGELRAGQVCGLLAVPGARLEILPKVGIDAAEGRETLVRMLAVAHDLRLSAGELAQMQDRRRDLLDIVLALFAARTLAAAKRGLPRAYLGREEELPLLRGSLDLTRQLTRRAGRPERLACRFDELSPDIALNQVIAAALTRTGRLARRDATRRALAEVAARYDEVSIPRRPLALSPTLGRGAAHWREPLALARMLLEGSHQGTHAGEGTGFALLFAMNDLFEVWTARLLRRRLGARLRTQDARHAVTECGRFSLRPDLVVELDDRIVVLDTKWKRLDSAARDLKVSSSDVYQMLAYAHAYGGRGKPVELALIYPAGPVPPGVRTAWRVAGTGVPMAIAAIDVADETASEALLSQLVRGTPEPAQTPDANGKGPIDSVLRLM